MLIKESKWIGNLIKEMDLKKEAVFLNFGSQSDSYNCDNDHIAKNVITPVREKYIIVNLDIKERPGVDISGDILDDHFFKNLKKYKFHCVLLCNVLEHVENHVELCRRTGELIKKNGYIIFSGPYDYPVHLDPIDNGVSACFRSGPSVWECAGSLHLSGSRSRLQE